MFGLFCGRTTVLLSQLTVYVAVALVCNKHENCTSCVNSANSCGWCKRDNECHTIGAFGTNPCKRAENIVSKSHCTDKLSSYDPDLSQKMLLLSAVAYDSVHPQECLDNFLPSDEFQLQIFADKNCDLFGNDCSGYVAVSHALKVIVVAFRGSSDFDQAFAQFVESLFAPKVKFFDGKVQTYWKRGFFAIWPNMEAEVKALLSTNPSYQIWVTGHSLGAALASLASTWLSYYKVAPRKNIILYTFGMPRVGNYAYALQHDQLVNNSWRVVNYNDLVPHFPIVVRKPSQLSGPYHHGVEVFYTEEAVSVNSPHRECHGKPYNEDATCSFSELKRSIEKHKTYFSIPVGTFWQTKCVSSTRKPGTATRKPGTAAKRSRASTLITSLYMYNILCCIYCCFLLSASMIFLLKDFDRL